MELGNGSARIRLHHAEGVFKIESAQECPPESVHIPVSGAGDRPSQPVRLGVAVATYVVELMTDDRALDDT